MKNTLSLTINLLFISLLFCSYGHATSDKEREELHRLTVEIKALDRLVESARRSAAKLQRYRFKYEQLNKDLEDIREGIEDYLNRVQRDPRTLRPVLGEYH